jgi:methylphosphotriester-DNA--protein-cysteine methyltransferase
MLAHPLISSIQLKEMIRQSQIKLAGNIKLKIYGTLECTSGKRMKKENRVFFKNEKEAMAAGFRPCGHCLSSDYKKWKLQSLFNR